MSTTAPEPWANRGEGCTFVGGEADRAPAREGEAVADKGTPFCEGMGRGALTAAEVEVVAD